jgi:hypothetical protein
VWGPRDSEATLEIRRGSEVVTTTRTRESSPEIPTEPRPEYVAELEPGIFYVNLDLAEMPEILDRIDEIPAADRVVFDLRGYLDSNHMVLTHLTDQNLNSAFWHIPQIIYPDHDGEAQFNESRWDLPPAAPRVQGKVVLLTNSQAISCSESVMGIVEA